MLAKNAAMLYKNDFDEDEKSDREMGEGGLGNELQELEDMDGGGSMGNSYIESSNKKVRRGTLDQLNQSYNSDVIEIMSPPQKSQP